MNNKSINKKLLLVFAITALVITISAPAFSADNLFDTATAAKYVEQGIAFLKAKKIDAAIKQFEEAAGVNPDAEAYYYLGYAYYLKGRKGSEESRKLSRENFDKAYEIDANFSPSRYKPAEPALTGSAQKKQNAAEEPAPPAQPEPQSQPTSTP